MDCWEILGIEQTDDIREIKKTYARQLRLHNPEGDPDGFMRLREAYEQALTLAVRTNINLIEANENGDEDIEPPLIRVVSPSVDDEQEAVARTLVWDKLEELYKDFERRMDLDEWQQLFDTLTIDQILTLQGAGAMFFNDHYVLPAYVWVYLDADLDLIGNPFFHYKLLLEVQNDMCAPLLRMFPNALPNFDLARYAELRVNVFIACVNGDLNSAQNYARQAIEFCDQDYLAHSILGGKFTYEETSPLCPYNDVKFQIVDLWTKNGEHKKARKEFRRLQKSLYEIKHIYKTFYPNNYEQQMSLDAQISKYAKMFFVSRYEAGQISKRRYERRLKQSTSNASSGKYAVLGFLMILLIIFLLILGIRGITQPSKPSSNTPSPTPIKLYDNMMDNLIKEKYGF